MSVSDWELPWKFGGGCGKYLHTERYEVKLLTHTIVANQSQLKDIPEKNLKYLKIQGREHRMD